MDAFSKSSLPKSLQADMIKKNIWSSKCPVSLERLNVVRVSYIDFEGNTHHDGKLVVMDVVADSVIAIFKELFENQFPIQSIKLINEYQGNDEKSMEANNSSAFNCRLIQGTNIVSIHSYGLAVDINPEQNPYILNKYELGKTVVPVYPPLGMNYINRRNIRHGMVEGVVNKQTGQTVIDIFHKHGFTEWGGNWNEPLDWHHFQLRRADAEHLAKISYNEGVKFFEGIKKGVSG